MSKSTNQIKAGAILSYIQMALSIIIGLIYTPVMIRLLGKSEYGLYNTVSSTISMLSILSLGFNSGYIRYYAKYKKNDDQESINKLNGLFIIIFSIIGVVALLCGLFLTFNLNLVFDEGLTTAEYEVARVLMLLLTINLATSFPFSVFSNIISANERFVFLKLLGMLKTVGGPLVTLPLLLMGYKSIAMVAVTLGISLVTDLIYFIYVKRVLKQKFVFHNFEKGIFKDLFIYISFVAINLIVDQINNNVDKFLLGRFHGTEVVAVYSVGFALYNYYKMFSTAISGVFTPRIHKIVNATKDNIDNQIVELSNLFIKVGRIQFLILALILTGIIFFGQPFIHYWAGEGYENAYFVALLVIIPATVPFIQNIGIEVQRALNKHQFRSIAYIIMAFINLGLTIWLGKEYKEVGAAIGTAISLVLANGIAMNIYYHKRCNINIIKFWKEILRLSLGLIIPIGVGIVIYNFINLYSVVNLLLFIGIYTIIYCLSMWFIGMNEYEKNLIKRFFGKIFHKSK